MTKAEMNRMIEEITQRAAAEAAKAMQFVKVDGAPKAAKPAADAIRAKKIAALEKARAAKKAKAQPAMPPAPAAATRGVQSWVTVSGNGKSVQSGSGASVKGPYFVMRISDEYGASMCFRSVEELSRVIYVCRDGEACRQLLDAAIAAGLPKTR